MATIFPEELYDGTIFDPAAFAAFLNKESALIPALKEFWSATSTTVVITTGAGHEPDDLLLAVGGAGTSATIPTLTGWGSPIYAAAHPLGSQSMAAYAMRATANNHTCVWSSSGLRGVWNLGKTCDIDAIVASFSLSTPTTAIDILAQTGMTPQSLMLLFAQSNTSQVSWAGSVVTPTGLTQRAQKLTASTAWFGDSGAAIISNPPTLLNAFDPPAAVLDTSAQKWSTLGISVRGRAA